MAAEGQRAGEGATGGPGCPNPENHCLPDEVFYFIAGNELNYPYMYVDPAKPKSPVEAAGEATFFNLQTTKDQVTRWWWPTVRATEADLVVGRTVVMLNAEANGIYHAPTTTQEAVNGKWWMAKIASTAPRAHNYVIVTGGYKVAVDALRVPTNTTPPAIARDLVSGEDAHFLTPNHWLVSADSLNYDYMYVSVAAPIQEPSAETKGEGHFFLLDRGTTLWTRHAWKTRPARREDLAPGVQVFMAHRESGSVYQPPGDRVEAVTGRWWTAKIIDTSQLYKGVVTVGGGYAVALEAIRVSR